LLVIINDIKIVFKILKYVCNKINNLNGTVMTNQDDWAITSTY